MTLLLNDDAQSALLRADASPRSFHTATEGLRAGPRRQVAQVEELTPGLRCLNEPTSASKYSLSG
ncbi:MAG: hypothetical protein JWN04_1065 [Myxococcaceae bacterium]|nr:hypothetical protein [Myxococcaceae bacterium]